MASLADMLYGSAQQAEQTQGAGLPDSIHQGAQLALQQQDLQMRQQQMAQQMQQLQNAKVEKLYDFMGGAMKAQNASEKQNMLKATVGYKNAMGIPDSMISPDGIMSLGTSESQQRMATLDSYVKLPDGTPGKLSAAEAIDLATNPLKADQFMKVPLTPLDFMDKSPNLSASQEFALKQSAESQKAAATNKTTLEAAAIRAGSGQQFKPSDVTSAQKNQAAQIGQVKGVDAVGPMLDARDRIAQSLAKDPSGASVTPQDLSAVLFPTLHGAVGRVTETEISKTLGMPGLAGMTQDQLTAKLVGGVNPKAAAAIMQWAEDGAKGVDAAVAKKASSIQASVQAMPNRTDEQKAALLSGLSALTQPTYRPRPGADSDTISFNGHMWPRAALQDAIKNSKDATLIRQATSALNGGQ